MMVPPGCALPNPNDSELAYMFAVNPWPVTLIILTLIVVVGLIVIVFAS